jgi:hypothetical protein
MRNIITLFTAAALIAAPTMASAAGSAFAPVSAGRAGAELGHTNAMGGKAFLGVLAIAAMGILAVAISTPNRPTSP